MKDPSHLEKDEILFGTLHQKDHGEHNKSKLVKLLRAHGTSW